MNNDIEIRIEDNNDINVDMSGEIIEKVVVQADWNENDPTKDGYIKNKPNLSNVATSGDYEDLSNKPTIPTKTSDLTNDSDFVDSNYVNGKIDDLKWELGANDLSLQTDTTVAYTKTVPTGAIGCKINKLGGMSYKSENLFNNTLIDQSNKSFNTDNNTFINNANYDIYGYFNVSQNTQYTISGYNNSDAGTTQLVVIYYDNTNTFIDKKLVTPPANSNFTSTFTTPANTTKILVSSRKTNQNVMLNLGSTALPYQPYFTGIRDSIITSVKSYDSNNNLIDTYTIDSNIQALEGYGRGINNNCYNVLDLNTKVFTDKDDLVDLGTLSWNYANSRMEAYLSTVKDYSSRNTNLLCANYNASTSGNDKDIFTVYKQIIIYDSAYNDADTFKTAMNGVPLRYERNTYNTTNVSQYITDNSIQVEAGGYLVFENPYGQAVPSDITYLIEVAR